MLPTFPFGGSDSRKSTHRSVQLLEKLAAIWTVTMHVVLLDISPFGSRQQRFDLPHKLRFALMHPRKAHRLMLGSVCIHGSPVEYNDF